MTEITPLRSRTTCALFLGLLFSANPALAAPVQLSARQTNPLSSQISKQTGGTWKLSQSFKPPNRGVPPATAGGATRGNSCLKGTQQLISLIPQNRLGLTTSAKPTFYWYVPQSSAATVKFLLLGNNDTDVVYEKTLNLPNQSGIINFSLPENAQTLEVGKQYHWYLIVGCNQLDQSANPSVEGWVERITPDAALSQKLKQANPSNQAALYANNGIWHEALTTVAQLRRSNPQDATAIAGWNQLLKSVGLSEIAAEPLLDVKISSN